VPGSAFHLERPAEGLDAVGKPSKSRPSGRICPTHAIVGDLDPDPAATDRHGNGDAGGGGVLGGVGEGLGADEVGGGRLDALGQLGPGDLEFDRKQEVSCQGGQRAIQPMAEARKATWSSTMSTVGRTPLIVPQPALAHIVVSTNHCDREPSRLYATSMAPQRPACPTGRNGPEL
jgi:hypothetical protein